MAVWLTTGKRSADDFVTRIFRDALQSPTWVHGIKKHDFRMLARLSRTPVHPSWFLLVRPLSAYRRSHKQDQMRVPQRRVSHAVGEPCEVAPNSFAGTSEERQGLVLGRIVEDDFRQEWIRSSSNSRRIVASQRKNAKGRYCCKSPFSLATIVFLGC